MIECYAFGWVPPIVRGLVRDLRVRWVLEEAGVPYRVTLVGDRPGQLAREEYRALQPFAQIPAIRDGELTLFESGAIVQYVAERSPVLWPESAADRIHTVQWMYAALNTIEVPITELAIIDLGHAGDAWAKERRPAVVDWVRTRLGELTASLGDREYLLGRFTAADLLMSSVLRILRHTDLVDEHPALAAYHARCEARPAFAKSLADQLAAFED